MTTIHKNTVVVNQSTVAPSKPTVTPPGTQGVVPVEPKKPCAPSSQFDCGDQKQSKMPCVDDALIVIKETVVTNEVIRVDPLYVTGTANPGAKVAIRNPDIKGWPEIATATADTSGKFSVEVTDASLFARGDRVWVTAEEPGMRESEGVLKRTWTRTDLTHTHRVYRGGSLVSESTRHSQVPHLRNADDRPPYFDTDAVKTTFGSGNDGITLLLSGGDRAVPPESTVSLGNVQATADRFGRFELNLSQLKPDTTLELTIQDVHGRITKLPFRVPSYSLNTQPLVAGARWEQGALHLQTGPFLNPGEKVAVHLSSTGKIHTLTADDTGALDARLEGVAPYQVLEVGTPKGDKADRIKQLVALPADCKSGALLDLDEVCLTVPSFKKSLPQARWVNGGLSIPPISHLPPFGVVEIVSEGKVLHSARADAHGEAGGVSLEGVAPGQDLSFITYDAGGRRLGVDVPHWCAPGETECGEEPTLRRRHANATLQELSGLIGTGQLEPGGPYKYPDSAIEVRTKLNPTDWHKFTGVRDSGSRLEVSGDIRPELWPELPTLAPDSVATLSSADWDTGARNVVFSLWDSKKGERTDVSVQVPLPVEDDRIAVENGHPMPKPEQCLALLKRATAFLLLARSVGQGPGDPAYEGPLRAAKALVFALDRIAVQNPAQAEALKTQASEVLRHLSEEELDAKRWVTPAGALPVSTSRDQDDFWTKFTLLDARDHFAARRRQSGQVG